MWRKDETRLEHFFSGSPFWQLARPANSQRLLSDYGRSKQQCGTQSAAASLHGLDKLKKNLESRDKPGERFGAFDQGLHEEDQPSL
jgi:hypothetical protein